MYSRCTLSETFTGIFLIVDLCKGRKSITLAGNAKRQFKLASTNIGNINQMTGPKGIKTKKAEVSAVMTGKCVFY